STRVPSVGYGLAAFTRPTGTWPAPTGGRVGGVFGTHRRQPILRWQDGLGSHNCGQCGTQLASAIRPALRRWVTAWRPAPTLPYWGVAAERSSAPTLPHASRCGETAWGHTFVGNAGPNP